MDISNKSQDFCYKTRRLALSNYLFFVLFLIFCVLPCIKPSQFVMQGHHFTNTIIAGAGNCAVACLATMSAKVPVKTLCWGVLPCETKAIGVLAGLPFSTRPATRSSKVCSPM